MKLNELRDNKGAVKNRKRVGRGMASGTGKTAGRGMKGQNSRSGGGVRLGFEGGQNPLYQRLPMRGFNNYRFRTEHTVVNVGTLQQLVDEKRIDATKEITIKTLQEIGLTKKAKDGLKVLGTGDIKAKLKISAAAASKSAMDKIAKAGGKIELPVKAESK